MKKTILITAFTLVFIFSLCGSVFAEESAGIQEMSNGPTATASSVNLEESSGSQVIMSNGLTATASRISSSYLRVVFKNSTSSTIKDTVNVADAVITGEHISGPFSISVPANGSKSYDVYVGGYVGVYVITTNHGYFYFGM